MEKIDKNKIKVENKMLEFDVPIKAIVKFKDIFIVLIREKKEIPNNIIAFDYDGNELWKINDIVQAKILRGYDDIKKISENEIEVRYELGIIFKIDIINKTILSKEYLR